jgi:ribosomal protection tetracycline resistance protein
VKFLNLGILAHVDAGKTSLTERLLFAAGVIDAPGRVDDGNTQTDSLDLERQRGITIKSAVVSFLIDDVAVNLIDTPGHPDFIAEVERVLSVLDGAVLVLSAVEGVQAQTKVLMRALQRLRIPTMIFVNKIDRLGARPELVVDAIVAKLSPAAIALGWVEQAGSKAAAFRPFDQTGEGLAEQTRHGAAYPIFFGSALTGAGVESIMNGLTTLLPAAEGDSEADVSGSVFKIEREPSGAQVAYVRMFGGTVRVRDRLAIGRDQLRKITGIGVFEQGAVVERTCVSAGQIGRLRGLSGIQIGDPIGSTGARPSYTFAPPTLQTIVVPARPSDGRSLQVALDQLAEQDPLIGVRRSRGEHPLLSLYGEVQKEVIQATLASDYDLAVSFEETTTICIERPVGTGSAVELIGTESNPLLATVGLRIDPAPVDSGTSFRLASVLHGTMPLSFFTAVEDSVITGLQHGNYGWQVTDCIVTMTHSGYYPRQSHAHATFDKSMSSTAGDFRQLTPMVLRRALDRAGTRVCEPMHRFRLECPAAAVGALLPVLGRLGALPDVPTIDGTDALLQGVMPASEVHRLTQQLPGLTSGEGLLESAFDHYRAIRGPAPVSPYADTREPSAAPGSP